MTIVSSFRNLSEASISLGGAVFFFGTRGIKACWEGPDLSFLGRWESCTIRRLGLGGNGMDGRPGDS
jgi:hypothetical protein